MPLNAGRLRVAGKGRLDVKGSFVRWKVRSSLKCRERILCRLRKQVGNALGRAKSTLCSRILTSCVIRDVGLTDMSRNSLPTVELDEFRDLSIRPKTT